MENSIKYACVKPYTLFKYNIHINSIPYHEFVHVIVEICVNYLNYLSFGKIMLLKRIGHKTPLFHDMKFMSQKSFKVSLLYYFQQASIYLTT